MNNQADLLIRKLRKIIDFDRVKFIILFGSQTTGRTNPMSDYDVAIYYEGNDKERFDLRVNLEAKLSDKFDVHIFQDLPLYVKKEVLKGKVLYAKDLTFLYDMAYDIIRKFEQFKKYYYDYIGLEELK